MNASSTATPLSRALSTTHTLSWTRRHAIDAVNRPFSEELVERIKNIIDPAQIDVLIWNRIEIDHSGSVPRILELEPNAEVYASAPQGVKELKAFYGENINANGVRMGDTLNIGKRILTFVQTPMAHWPDNMVIYSDYDKILFSNDAFGQHYASSTRFEDESDYSVCVDRMKWQIKPSYLLRIWGFYVQ